MQNIIMQIVTSVDACWTVEFYFCFVIWFCNLLIFSRFPISVVLCFQYFVIFCEFSWMAIYWKLHMSVIWSLRFSPHKRQRKVKIRICALPLVHTSKTFRSEPRWAPNVNSTLDRYTHFDHTTYFYNSTYKKILNKCNLLQTNE